MGDHMPVHLGAMPEFVPEALAAHALEPGDVVFLQVNGCPGSPENTKGPLEEQAFLISG